VQETYQDRVKLETKNNVTWCQVCDHQCHAVCGVGDGEDKKGCSAMNQDGYCRECHGHCHYSQHRNAHWYYAHVTKTREVTKEEMKAKYFDAKSQFSEIQQIVGRLLWKLNAQRDAVQKLVETLRTCVNELQQYALKPCVFESAAYFDMLIQNEESNAKPNYQERIRELEKLRDKQVYGKSVMEGSHSGLAILDDDPDIKKFVQENKIPILEPLPQEKEEEERFTQQHLKRMQQLHAEAEGQAHGRQAHGRAAAQGGGSGGGMWQAMKSVFKGT